MDVVTLTSRAKKDLIRTPEYSQVKFYDWARNVEEFGLEQVRKTKGYHDEPLQGDRKGRDQFACRWHIGLFMRSKMNA